MSMFRKTILTTAIVGAGLASTTGAAFAGDCPTEGGHGHGHASHEKTSGHKSGTGCSNATEAENSNGAGAILGDVLGGDQSITSQNFCNNLNGNKILSDNNVSLLGNIHNGDETTNTVSSQSAAAQGRNASAGTTTTPIR